MISGARILIAGGTGMIGSALIAELSAGGAIVDVLTRGDTFAPRNSGIRAMVHWEPGVVLEIDPNVQYDIIINLAGYSLSHLPWTSKRRSLILHSRLDATSALIEWMRSSTHPPHTFINASAVGFYGDRGDEVLTEASGHGTGFLADVVAAWEEEASDALTISHAKRPIRVAWLRTGLVLGPSGALSPVRLLTSLGVGGRLGTGNQWWPWVSLRDEVRAIVHVIERGLSGPINLVGPTPATQEEIGRTLAQLMGKPFWLPAPRFAISLLLGVGGRELLLTSQRVSPVVLAASGFRFEHTNAREALNWVLDELATER